MAREEIYSTAQEAKRTLWRIARELSQCSSLYRNGEPETIVDKAVGEDIWTLDIYKGPITRADPYDTIDFTSKTGAKKAEALFWNLWKALEFVEQRARIPPHRKRGN